MGYDYSRIQLDMRAEAPLFEQIAARLRDDIVRGQIAIDERLPTVRSLAQQLNINFNTVARAYRILDAEGLILSRQGQGSYVTANQLFVPAGEIEAAQAQKLNPQEKKDASLAELVRAIEAMISESGYDMAQVLRHWNERGNQPGITPRRRKIRTTRYPRKKTADSYLAILQAAHQDRRK